MLRYFLVLIALFLAARIIRGVVTYLFPRISRRNFPNNPPTQGMQKDVTEYQDVQDAKFKDVSQ